MSTYDSKEMEINFKREDRYWWFVGRRAIIKQLIEGEYPGQNNLYFLDAGCGSGATLKALSFLGKGVGCDISPDAHSFCRKRGLDILVGANLNDLPFENEVFDLVVMMDVIYSKWVPDEKKVLEEVKRVLKQNGKFVITEGAFMLLMSNHNKRVGAVRRYTKKTLNALLKESGFVVKKISYWNMFLFPLFLTAALIDKIVDDDSRSVSTMDHEINPLLNFIFTGLLYIETWIMRYISLPIGASIVAVGQKR